ncbi:hypothetical protein GCM10010423_43590 [Streptomyces levis]|uniref:Uncharacterized protein n=1 Tax=Streptomyces levis TaxID=285566 RepID=A0ABN3NXK1_9ACTN
MGEGRPDARDDQRGGSAGDHHHLAAAAAYPGRSRNDEKLTVVIVLVFGVLIAPTAFGQGIVDVISQLVQGVSQPGR